MACKNCTGKFQGRCDCCYLVDGTEKIKEVVFCEKCDAFICKECQSNWLKRSIAYFVKKITKAEPVDQPVMDVVLSDTGTFENPKEYEEGNPNEETV